MESLVTFVPSIYAAALFQNPVWAAGLGAVYVAGRLAYGIGYKAKPEAREYGFLTSFLASTVLLGMGVFGAGRFLYKHCKH